eukprot:358344-Chlamydomonas_euryale.AAC.11
MPTPLAHPQHHGPHPMHRQTSHAVPHFPGHGVDGAVRIHLRVPHAWPPHFDCEYGQGMEQLPSGRLWVVVVGGAVLVSQIVGPSQVWSHSPLAGSGVVGLGRAQVWGELRCGASPE